MKHVHWWLFIGSPFSNRIISAKRIPGIKDRKTLKIQFAAPPQVGEYPFSVFLKSDTYLGSDMRMDVQMKVEEGRVVEAVEDDISEPDEDTLGGQIQMMKRGRMAMVNEHEEQHEASDTSDEDE